MNFNFEELDIHAHIVFVILFISLTSSQMSYRLTGKIDPFIHNPAILLGLLLILIFNVSISNKKIRIGLLIGSIFAFGIYLRMIHVLDPTIYSDVLIVTEEAVRVVLSGDNIYLHDFQFSNPPGQSFKYGPFEPIFYIPFYFAFKNLAYAEIFSSLVVMILIFYMGRLIGYAKILIPLALYSSWGIIIENAGAGVNDDSAGMLGFVSIFLLILALRKSNKKFAITSSVFLGIAICFKLFPALFVPFIILLIYNLKKDAPLNWKYYFVIVIITIFSLSLPYLIVSPKAFLNNIFVGNTERTVVSLFQWNIWNLLMNKRFIFYIPKIFNTNVVMITSLVPKIMLTISFAFMILLLFLFRKNLSLSKSIGYGIIVWLVLLISGPWFPSSFFSFIAPFVCTLPILDLTWKSSV